MRIPDLENLKKVFSQYPEIRAVYLFGSRASGRVHRESDLDLAVLKGISSRLFICFNLIDFYFYFL